MTDIFLNKIYTGVIYVPHIQVFVCKITEIYTDATCIYQYVPHIHVYKVRDVCTFVKIHAITKIVHSIVVSITLNLLEAQDEAQSTEC